MANANRGWKPRALTNSFSPGKCVAHRGDVDGAAGVARRDVHGRAGARAGDAAGAAVRGAAASSEARQELEKVIGADGSVAVDVGGTAGGLLGRDLWVPGGRRGLAGRGTHAGFGAGPRAAGRSPPRKSRGDRGPFQLGQKMAQTVAWCARSGAGGSPGWEPRSGRRRAQGATSRRGRCRA